MTKFMRAIVSEVERRGCVFLGQLPANKHPKIKVRLRDGREVVVAVASSPKDETNGVLLFRRILSQIERGHNTGSRDFPMEDK